MMWRVAMEEGDRARLAMDIPAGAWDLGPQNDLDDLQSEEDARLVAYCEAPALLWRTEPFGMIA